MQNVTAANENPMKLIPVVKTKAKPQLIAKWAQTPSELLAIQRLRAEVFGKEYGISFDGPQGIDTDRLDLYCEHLMVYDVANSCVVATTRVLDAENAKAAGGFYSANEFDVTAITNLQGRVLELGRTCVDPEYRSGAAITVLWSALADYLMANNFNYLIGCASISLSDGGYNFANIMPSLRENYFVAPELRVSPNRELIIEAASQQKVVMPPLLKAYLKMGCKIGGEACWDPEFNCADVFVLLDVAALSARYAMRFLKTA